MTSLSAVFLRCTIAIKRFKMLKCQKIITTGGDDD